MKEVKNECCVCAAKSAVGWVELHGKRTCIECFKSEVRVAVKEGYDPQKEFKRAARALNKMTKEVK